MVQYLEKYKQNIAIDMRKRGLSYSEIGNRIHVPKSTLSYWLKNIKLTLEQIKKLNDKRVNVAKTNAIKKISKTTRMIEEIKNSSSRDIKEISKKELWLIGLMLYWKNGNKNDLRKGLHFSSGDPHKIRLFLKWLKEIGKIENKEIKFNIFTTKNKSDEAVNYWSKITGFSKTCFFHIYFQNKNKKNYNKVGFLRIMVTQSSMLARQISGWVEGIIKITNS